jgi:hypothetical protein
MRISARLDVIDYVELDSLQFKWRQRVISIDDWEFLRKTLTQIFLLSYLSTLLDCSLVHILLLTQEPGLQGNGRIPGDCLLLQNIGANLIACINT